LHLLRAHLCVCSLRFSPCPCLHFFCLLLRPPPPSTLFPYTTLFRSSRDPQRNPTPALLAGEVESVRGPLSPGKLAGQVTRRERPDRKSTRLNSSHQIISYAVFCLKKKNKNRRLNIKRWFGHSMTSTA